MYKHNSKLDQISKVKRIKNAHHIRAENQKDNIYQIQYNRLKRIPTRREKRNMRELFF